MTVFFPAKAPVDVKLLELPSYVTPLPSIFATLLPILYSCEPFTASVLAAEIAPAFTPVIVVWVLNESESGVSL